MKRQLILLTIGIAAVALMLWWANFDEVYTVIAGLDRSFLLVICSIQLFKYVLLSLQWTMIVRAAGHSVSFGTMTHIIMSGKFIESVTPGFKLGGEVTKTIMLQNHTPLVMAEAIAVTATPKTLNFLAFVVICLVSITFLFADIGIFITPSLKATLLTTMLALAALCLLLVVLVVNPQWAGKLLPRKPLEKFRSTIACMYKRPLWLLGQLTLTLVIWATYAVIAVVAGEAIGLGIRHVYTVIASYLSYMLGMVPLLPGGLGTTEMGLTGILTVFRVPMSTAVAMTLVLRFATYWIVLLVSMLWFFGSRALKIISLHKRAQQG